MNITTIDPELREILVDLYLNGWEMDEAKAIAKIKQALYDYLVARLPEKISNTLDINSRSWGYANGHNQALSDVKSMLAKELKGESNG